MEGKIYETGNLSMFKHLFLKLIHLKIFKLKNHEIYYLRINNENYKWDLAFLSKYYCEKKELFNLKFGFKNWSIINDNKNFSFINIKIN